jgi:hypothetical protein
MLSLLWASWKLVQQLTSPCHFVQNHNTGIQPQQAALCNRENATQQVVLHPHWLAGYHISETLSIRVTIYAL